MTCFVRLFNYRGWISGLRLSGLLKITDRKLNLKVFREDTVEATVHIELSVVEDLKSCGIQTSNPVAVTWFSDVSTMNYSGLFSFSISLLAFVVVLLVMENSNVPYCFCQIVLYYIYIYLIILR